MAQETADGLTLCEIKIRNAVLTLVRRMGSVSLEVMVIAVAHGLGTGTEMVEQVVNCMVDRGEVARVKDNVQLPW